MIGKRKSVNVINRTGTPVMSVVTAIGKGDELALIKQKFPVTDKAVSYTHLTLPTILLV